MIEALRFINVLGAAIMAGGQLFVLMVVIPIKRQWDERRSVELHQASLHTLPDRYLLPAGVISGLAGLLWLVLEFGSDRWATWLTLVGLLGIVGTAVTSQRFNKPTNRTILGWSLDAIPPGYAEIRDRWDRVHTIRTASGLLALTAFLLAAVLE